MGKAELCNPDLRSPEGQILTKQFWDTIPGQDGPCPHSRLTAPGDRQEGHHAFCTILVHKTIPATMTAGLHFPHTAIYWNQHKSCT